MLKRSSLNNFNFSYSCPCQISQHRTTGKPPPTTKAQGSPSHLGQRAKLEQPQITKWDKMGGGGGQSTVQVLADGRTMLQKAIRQVLKVRKRC